MINLPALPLPGASGEGDGLTVVLHTDQFGRTIAKLFDDEGTHIDQFPAQNEPMDALNLVIRNYPMATYTPEDAEDPDPEPSPTFAAPILTLVPTYPPVEIIIHSLAA